MSCLCFALTYHRVNCCHLAGKISHVFPSVTLTYQITEKVLCCAGQATPPNRHPPAHGDLGEGKAARGILTTNLLNQIFQRSVCDEAVPSHRKASECMLDLNIKKYSKSEGNQMILWLCKLRSSLNCPASLVLKWVHEIVCLIEKCRFVVIFL